MFAQDATHIMLDHESASLDNNAALISLAAVRFHPTTPVWFDTFYERIALDSSEKAGLHVSKSTLAWWETQSLEARTEAFGGTRELLPVLEEFREFINQFNAEKVILYSRGWKDFVWLHSAFDACFLNFPLIHYRNEIDMRSLEMFVPEESMYQLPRAHNALDDCKQQIKRVHSIYTYFKGQSL
jgi:hypothetical protein